MRANFQLMIYRIQNFLTIKKTGAFSTNLAEQNSVDIDLNERLNISILIIVGSSIDCIQSRFIDGIYQKNAEDLSTALLLRHLFHNSYGIPFNQILITSTQESDFYVKDTETELISQPNAIFKGVNDSFLEKTDFHFTNKNEIEFMLHQKINIAQVGDKQYKFFMKESLASIVKPFNINIIKKELTTNDNSDLLVFFLDHGYTGGFSDDFPYQFFIERLLEINCKYFYVFNDSCGSGSLIKLINISRDFQSIFPNINNPTLESAMFYFLTNLNKVYPAGVKDAIESKLYKIDSYECSSKIKEEMITRLNQINESSYQQISDFILNFDVEFRSVGCVPQHFLQFAKKATIFTSSLYNEKSLTLPGRKINISILDSSRIRVFGSIFSSILIEAFFHTQKGHIPHSLRNFSQFISEKLISYKKKFMDIIIVQNAYINEMVENKSLLDKKAINSFFSSNLISDDLYYHGKDTWPDFSSIMIDKNYWNVDVSTVDQNEYQNVFFCMFKMNLHGSISNPNNFGPTKGKYNMDKFMNDFEFSVNSLIKSKHLSEKFVIDNSKSKDQPIDLNCSGYGQFISLIRPVINCYNWPAIQLLKEPMSNFFCENPNNDEMYANIFSDAFKNIIPFWKGYDL
ncbi:hypothetical protein M9Y10_019851 [Tritrichomonas musculus]|uniref:Uncharacterized protein n=1 Tax=Tritrichomonas musculus TaxID=1915356 RepID=A0ABR2HJM8_9EUKA